MYSVTICGAGIHDQWQIRALHDFTSLIVYAPWFLDCCCGVSFTSNLLTSLRTAEIEAIRCCPTACHVGATKATKRSCISGTIRAFTISRRRRECE